MHWTPKVNLIDVVNPGAKLAGTIHDRHGNPIALNDRLNCQSQNVVYVIECQNCKIRYVGQTSQKTKTPTKSTPFRYQQESRHNNSQTLFPKMPQYRFPSDHAGRTTNSHYSRRIHFHEITWQCRSDKVFSKRTILDQTPENTNSLRLK